MLTIIVVSSILVTLIFLLADGAPASHGDVRCTGVTPFVAGDDRGIPTSDPTLLIDSRGAVVLSVERGTTITCDASKLGERWSGSLVLDRRVIRISLNQQDQAEDDVEDK